MIGVVLAAGGGQRLRPHTDRLPKTLIAVDGNTTILDVILRNLAAVGVAEVAIVVGYAAEAIEVRADELSARHGVTIRLVPNSRTGWNNAYSLWLARDTFTSGALVVNGDTLHPVDVEKCLIARRGPDLLLAVDTLRPLTGEAMKVTVDGSGRVRRIAKSLPVTLAHGEYVGACLVEPDIAADLSWALEATWRQNPDMYYEDGFQLLADGGAEVWATELGAVEWVEVDDHADLLLARDIACRC